MTERVPQAESRRRPALAITKGDFYKTSNGRWYLATGPSERDHKRDAARIPSVATDGSAVDVIVFDEYVEGWRSFTSAPPAFRPSTLRKRSRALVDHAQELLSTASRMDALANRIRERKQRR